MAARHALRLVQLGFSSIAEVLRHEGSHLKSPNMATRHAMGLVQHRSSSSGKVVNEEEKVAENVFTKAEYDKLAQRTEALKKDNVSLNAEVASLREEVSDIRRKYEQLHTEHAEIKGVYDNLILFSQVSSVTFVVWWYFIK